MNCKVVESTFNDIKCTLEKKTTESSNLTSNAIDPTNTYISGSGFFYQRYNLVNVTQSVTTFKQLLDTNGISASKLQDSYISG